MSDKTTTSRRDLLIGALALTAVGGGWQAWVHRPRAMVFAPIEGLPGWRQTAFEGVSSPRGSLSASAALAGISDGEAAPTPILSPTQLCQILFSDPTSAKVPVAVFSDFFCPYCRTLTERLAIRANQLDSKVAINWHELPLLGPSSIAAARAAVAADLQQAYPAFQSRMMGAAFRPTQNFLADIAVATGLDQAKFIADMDGQTVTSRLSQSRAASRTLGIYGTPAMVVGRTLVIGEITDKNLDILIEMETGTPPTC